MVIARLTEKERKMSRKDYELIAQAIYAAVGNPDNDMQTLRATAYTIANKLQRENMRFNLEKFIKACGF